MRVALAGIFVCASLLGAVMLLSELRVLETLPAAVVGPGLGILLVVLCVGTLVLFNRGGADSRGFKSAAEQIRELEEQNALVATDFRANRAFEVEEWEDEGTHYFIELMDGSVLYVNGQYLYDYEEIVDDPEGNQPRRFPCSDFTIRRHRAEGFVVDIQCRGTVLEPEIVAVHFSKKQFRDGRVPDDGDLLQERTYDDIKAEFAAKVAQRRSQHA